MADLGWSQEGDVVTLRMTDQDYEELMNALAYALGSLEYRGASYHENRIADLAGRVNQGNPEYLVSWFRVVSRNVYKNPE